MNFFRQEQTYTNITDGRTIKQYELHHRLAIQIHQHNLKTFDISITEKSKKEYAQKKLKKIQLDQGWYCYITDNQNKSENVIFTIHGAPGNHKQWAGLEQQTLKRIQCRWINFLVPGFDGEDQRRGTYNGTKQHFGQLIVKTLKYLNIPKIFLCGHSMGSLWSTYIITTYPTIIQGYINITGIVDQWYVGMLVFYQRTISSFEFNKSSWKKNNFLDNNEFRAKLRIQFLEKIEDTYFGSVEFPRLTQSQLCAYIKLFNSFDQGFSIMYTMNRNLQIPRVLIFGRTDPIHQTQKVQQSIFNVCFGRQSYLNKPKTQIVLIAMKKKFDEQMSKILHKKLEISRFQQYLCYYFENTGHNAHKRRPIEIARILEIYITFMKIYNKYRIVRDIKL